MPSRRTIPKQLISVDTPSAGAKTRSRIGRHSPGELLVSAGGTEAGKRAQVRGVGCVGRNCVFTCVSDAVVRNPAPGRRGPPGGKMVGPGCFGLCARRDGQIG